MSEGKPVPSRFLTVAEVAEILRVSNMTVYRLVQAQEIEAVRFGRLYRVSEESVGAYVRRSAIEKPPPART